MSCCVTRNSELKFENSVSLICQNSLLLTHFASHNTINRLINVRLKFVFTIFRISNRQNQNQQ